MSVPVLAIPEFKVKLFSLPKPVRTRPYLVGEEKIMLLAQESGDPKDIKAAVKTILEACTFGQVNIGKLPSFDFEWLYLQLRAKSVNNIVTLKYRCRNIPEGSEKECGASVDVEVNLDKLELKTSPDHSNKIWLNEDVGIILNYPTKEILDEVESVKGVFGTNLLVRCLDSIFTKSGDVTEAKDADPAEIEKFINSISIAQFKKIQHFFDTMPHLDFEVDFKCSKCQYAQKVMLQGLMDFFV